MEHRLIELRNDTKTSISPLFSAAVQAPKLLPELFDAVIKAHPFSSSRNLIPVPYGSFQKHPRKPTIDVLVSQDGLLVWRGGTISAIQEGICPVPPKHEDGKAPRFHLRPVISLNQYAKDVVLADLGKRMIDALGTFNTMNLWFQIGLFMVNGYMHDQFVSYVGGLMNIKQVGPPHSGKSSNAGLGGSPISVGSELVFGKTTWASQFNMDRVVCFFIFFFFF